MKMKLSKLLLIFSLITLTALVTGCESGDGGSDVPSAPDTPASITVVPAKGGATTVTWTGNRNDGSYTLIYNTENSTTSGSPETETSASSGIEITGLTIGETYYFWIVPVEEGGAELTPAAAPNNAGGGYTMPDYDDPDTPEDVTVEISSNGTVSVSWKGGINDGSYKVYADENQILSDGTFAAGSEPGYDEMEARHYDVLYGLTSGSDYYICVVPVKQDGSELTPAWHSVQIHMQIPPDLPANVTAVIDGAGNVQVTWDGNVNDGTYEIRCSQIGTPINHWTERYEDVTSPYTISDLPTGTWYIRVVTATVGTTNYVAANSGNPVEVWIPHLINEISVGAGVGYVQSDGEYIYYTDYSNNFGIIDIRNVTDFSEGNFAPVPVKQEVSSATIRGLAIVNSEAYFALQTGPDEADPELARIVIAKSPLSLAAPTPYNLTGSTAGYVGNNVVTDGTYLYLLALNKDSPQRLWLNIFNPGSYTWGASRLIDPSDNGYALTYYDNTVYADVGNKIASFDVSTGGSIGEPANNILSDYSNQIIAVSENHVFVAGSGIIKVYAKTDYSEVASINYGDFIHTLFVSGNTLFVTNSSTSTEGMGIIDITDPANPGDIRWVTTGSGSTDNDKKAAGVAVVGDYAFIGTPLGITVVQLAQ